MAWAKVQGTTVIKTTGTTLTNNAWGTAPTAGNLLVMWALIDRSSATTSANAVAGWTGPIVPTGGNEAINGTRHIGFYVYWRLADGSNTSGHDAAPAVTISNNSGAVGWCDEFSGVDATTQHDADGVIVSTNATSGTVIPSVSVSQGGDLVVTVGAGNSGVAPSLSFGGGASVDRAVDFYNSALYYASAFQSLGAGSGTANPTVAVAGIGSTGLPIIAGLSIAFRGAVVPSDTSRQVNVAGSFVAVTRKVNVAGSWTSATRKINSGGIFT